MYMYFDLENPFLTPISLWAKATYAMIWCPTSYIYINSLNDGCQILKQNSIVTHSTVFGLIM